MARRCDACWGWRSVYHSLPLGAARTLLKVSNIPTDAFWRVNRCGGGPDINRCHLALAQRKEGNRHAVGSRATSDGDGTDGIVGAGLLSPDPRYTGIYSTVPQLSDRYQVLYRYCIGYSAFNRTPEPKTLGKHLARTRVYTVL